MTSLLWAARHGPVQVSGLCYGRYEVPVTLEPVAAAMALMIDRAPYRETLPVIWWTSPSRRCLDVARVLVETYGGQLCMDKRLAEIDYGRWEGRHWADIEREEPERWRGWMEDWKNAAPPGGETLEGLECRVRAWWYSLLETSAHRLIGHAGVLRTLRVLTKKVPWDDAIAGRVEHLRWAAYPLFYESSSSRLFG